jgi:hypothetical protein
VIVATQEEPGMFDFYQGRPSFLPVHRYGTPVQISSLRTRQNSSQNSLSITASHKAFVIVFIN